MTENKVFITPKTKVFDLLEAYPQFEETLSKLVPALDKLKNPVLRNTVGKVSTLQQIASMAHKPVDELINMLRKEVGQEVFIEKNLHGIAANPSIPKWFSKEKITVSLDVRPMLEAGEHPVHQVMADLNQLPAGKIYKMTSSFLPAPLIDKASSIGCKHWVEKIKENEFNVYFTKN